MKNRPVSANPVKKFNHKPSTSPLHNVKRDLRILMSSEQTSKFLDGQIFKLTEAGFPDCKELASTQISQDLKLLKTFTNTTQLSKTQTNSKINRLALELSQARNTESYIKNKIPELLERVEALKKEISTAKKQQEDKLADREVYLHVEKRLVTTRIHLDIKNHFLQTQLNNKDHVLSVEREHQMKTRENRCRSARMYKDFTRYSRVYDKNKTICKKMFDKDLEILESTDMNRLRRQQRHLEIYEEVENEENIRKYTGKRESIMLYKLWNMYLSNKLKDCAEKFGTMELAYKKIRSVTGLQNINQVVEKFLTKESSFQELMTMILAKKKEKDSYFKRNSELEVKVEKIIMAEKQILSGDLIGNLSKEISNVTNMKSHDSNRQEKLKNIKANVVNWVKRLVKLFKPEFVDQNESLQELIILLKANVLGLLKSIGPIDEKTGNQKFSKDDIWVFNRDLKNKSYIVSKIDHIKSASSTVKLSDLYNIDESTNGFKKHFFIPLLEKTLKKKSKIL